MERRICGGLCLGLLCALLLLIDTGTAAGSPFQKGVMPEPLGLYRVIGVQGSPSQKKIYVIVGMTSRRMPLSVLNEVGIRLDTLQAVAEKIARLPVNTRVYIARPDDFLAEPGQLIRLSDPEIATLRKLLDRKRRAAVLVE
jgi:hypothetical protein